MFEKWSPTASLHFEKLTWQLAEQRNKCPSAQVNVWRWQNIRKKGMTQISTSEIDLGGVSNHLSLSLITFDSIVVCRDIKVDSVTKLPQWGTYEGILSLTFPSCSTSHLHKSTQTFISNQEYKAVTHSLLLEMTALKPQWRYNNHIKLAHQHFKTLSVIICCTTTPNPRAPESPTQFKIIFR